MRRILLVLSLALFFANTALGQAHLVPTDPNMAPLAMVAHHVNVAIDEQVAVTRVEQTFRNNSPRQLEATYVFPVPKGADVRRFSMWVDGKEVPGELVEADKAREIYTDIVRRTMDPGLLEYMDNQLLKFADLPRAGQRRSEDLRSATPPSPTSENGLIEYVYPMRADNKAFATHDNFSLNVTAQVAASDPEHLFAVARHHHDQAQRSRGDRQLRARIRPSATRTSSSYYTIGTKDVGLNMLTHRPSAGQNGYFMLLVSPRAELSKIAEDFPRHGLRARHLRQHARQTHRPRPATLSSIAWKTSIPKIASA